MAEPNKSTPNTRRSNRSYKPSLKAQESLYITKLTNSGFVAEISSDDEPIYFLSPDEHEDSIDLKTPKLLHNNEIVHGDEIFRFQSRKQKDSLAQKVLEACNQKTPYKVRNKFKQHIVAKILEEDSGSEYEGSSSETSDDEEISESQSSDSSSTSEKDVKQQHKKFVKTKIQQTVTRARKPAVNTNYKIKTEEYFSNYSSSKTCTSNNTLDKLETPRLPQYQLQKILSGINVSKGHQKSIYTLRETNKNNFNKWLYLLNENFNMLVYGLGSKKNILTSFQMEYLSDLPVIVVNGFFPSLSIKTILDSIITDLLELKENPSSTCEACELIEQEFSYIPETHLYLIIHNIEGDMFLNSKAQNVLARLASVKNIHLIASIDHINAPLIWDHNKLSKFNFIWWDVTSFLPYIEETSFERSMMVQKTGNLALSSLRNVFLSLTSNSKSIYLLIVKHQLDNGNHQYYQGFAFKDLYMACREAFIVSSDLALRAQLTEFIDHKMVKLKRSVDGTEFLIIPIGTALLQKFLDEHSQ